MGAIDYKFRLYVTGQAPNSVRALANLTELCQLHFKGRHQIEVVDLLREPQRALTDRVFVTPTLVRLAPLPELRIVGSLTESRPILEALGVKHSLT